MHLLQQFRLIVGLLEIVNHKVLHELAFLVLLLFDGDGSQIDEFQNTGREQVVIVRIEVFVGVQHIIDTLQISVVRDIPIPHQVLVHLFAFTPYIYHITDQYEDGEDDEAEDKGNEDQGVLPRPFVLVGIVTAVEGKILDIFEATVSDIRWFE